MSRRVKNPYSRRDRMWIPCQSAFNHHFASQYADPQHPMNLGYFYPPTGNIYQPKHHQEYHISNVKRLSKKRNAPDFRKSSNISMSRPNFPVHNSNSSNNQQENTLNKDKNVEHNEVISVSSGDDMELSSIDSAIPSTSAMAENHNSHANDPLFETSLMSDYCVSLSDSIIRHFIKIRQSPLKYSMKVQLQQALYYVVSAVFDQCGLFIVGSSLNGFGSDDSDMDLCLIISSKEINQSQDGFFILNRLLGPLRKCSMFKNSLWICLDFLKNMNLIRAKVPILKFHDCLAHVDCDLNVNNVNGIYNTHLLAMYTKVDPRLRPLGLFVKHWAQSMDIHDGSKGRLSTYPLMLMVIQYLQHGCDPPVLPNLQKRFPECFDYNKSLNEVNMKLALPWAELRSMNSMSLGELFVGFIRYYSEEFNFSSMAVSVASGCPIPINLALRRMPVGDPSSVSRSFKIFVEEPFVFGNAARSLFSDPLFEKTLRAFALTNQCIRSNRSLENLYANQ